MTALQSLRESLTLRAANEQQGLAICMQRSIGLELEEAMLCLDRPEPNIGMAMNRLRDIAQILRRTVEEQTAKRNAVMGEY
jgi:hypothetical protein